MIAASCATPASSTETLSFQSAIFQFPGRPLPLARRLAVYNRVKRLLREFMADQRFNEVPAPVTGTETYLDRMLDRGFPAVWSESQVGDARGESAGEARRELFRALGAELDLDALLLLEGILLRTVVENLSADLLGGRQITRLDRVLTCDHHRLTYARALEILADHGHQVEFGQPLDAKAATDLARFCSNQPVSVTGIPAAMAGPGLAARPQPGPLPEYHGYILPYAGLTLLGLVVPGEKLRGGFTLDLGRLLQFLMGLENIEDTVISPRQGLAGA